MQVEQISGAAGGHVTKVNKMRQECVRQTEGLEVVLKGRWGEEVVEEVTLAF